MRFQWPAAIATLVIAPAASAADWVFPGGVNAGTALHGDPAPAGLVLGGEASAALVDSAFTTPTFWRGAYVDGVYDFAIRRTRFGIGPEVGVAFLGIDGGFVAQVGDGALRPGFCVRPLLTTGLVSAYARLVFVPGDPVYDRATEIGVLLKWPFGIPWAAIRGALPH